MAASLRHRVAGRLWLRPTLHSGRLPTARRRAHGGREEPSQPSRQSRSQPDQTAANMMSVATIPLSLYIHLPWCALKCPYCDFNSHEGFSPELQQPYVDALLADLSSQTNELSDRTIGSIFIGGGTPSLFEGQWIARLLDGIRGQLKIADDAEITLETNPGSARERFAAYRAAGVNRLSIGVQTFQDALLQALGRVHRGDDARRALDMAAGAGFDRWNIDLMHGLPGQTAELAQADLEGAIALSAGHISWYQLTIERNTRFWSTPPPCRMTTPWNAFKRLERPSCGTQASSNMRYQLTASGHRKVTTISTTGNSVTTWASVQARMANSPTPPVRSLAHNAPGPRRLPVAASVQPHLAAAAEDCRRRHSLASLR